MLRSKLFNKRGIRIVLSAVLASVLVSTLAFSQPAQAHCDSEKGPVATAAHKAMQTNNINLILPYVKPEAEKELTAAFLQAREVRKAGGKSTELADNYFIETAIRLHRAGEGAPYTGVTDEQTPASIVAADKAMASGSLEEVNKMLAQAMQKNLEAKYEAVVHAREEAKKLGTVEAHRERVEAELMFEKYVYELYTLASAEVPPAEGHGH